MKHTIGALISSRKLFFGTMILLVLVSAVSLFIFGEGLGFIPSSNYHPFWLNVFFINYTFMANGLFVVCLASVLIFRFKRKQQGIAMLNGFLLSVLLVQVLKNINNFSQPVIQIEAGQNLFFTDAGGIAGGFISGHTAIAFALATVLALLAKNTRLQLTLLFGALLLGYSRMYLAQHALLDILIGAVVGTISGVAAVYVAYYFKGVGYYYKKLFNLNKNPALKRERNMQPV